MEEKTPLQRLWSLRVPLLLLGLALGGSYAYWQTGVGDTRVGVSARMLARMPLLGAEAEAPVVRPMPGPVAGLAEVTPSFDVVRVSPQGNAVIAGRAAPGSDVIVFDGDRVVARATADRRGEFVALPAEPLPAGGRELTLAARRPLGGVEVRGEQSVVVVVPEAGRPGVAAGAPVVALLDPRRGARLLQEADGGRPDAVRPGGKRGAGLSLDVVDYDDKGAVRFSGRAAPGAAVRVYVDNGAVGDARADEAGRWGLVPEGAIAAGVHTLRADAVDGGGRVTARVELPFQRAAASVLDAGGRVVVQPGQNLWRLARAAYGSGVRYTVIYQANQGQIRDPRLIYPGQAFAMPLGGP